MLSMKRCPRKSGPDQICDACNAAERIAARLDCICFSATDPPNPQQRWMWTVERMRRWEQDKRIEQESARRIPEHPTWWTDWRRAVLNFRRENGIGQLYPRCAGGCSTADIDSGGYYDVARRHYEESK